MQPRPQQQPEAVLLQMLWRGKGSTKQGRRVRLQLRIPPPSHICHTLAVQNEGVGVCVCICISVSVRVCVCV